MKKIILLILFSAFAIVARAQEEPKSDTTRIKLGNSIILIYNDTTAVQEKKERTKKDQFKTRWAGFEIGINGFLTAGNSLELPEKYELYDLRYPKSVVVHLNFYEKGINLGSEKFKLVSGLGLAFNNYRFRRNILLQTGNNFLETEIDSINFTKNKLAVTYLHAPLMLQAFTGSDPKKSLHISAGVLAGLRLGSHTKQKYEIEGKTYKPKAKDDFFLNPFKLDATARIGFGNLTFFANYGLNPLFREGKGPQLYPFTVGISLIGI